MLTSCSPNTTPSENSNPYSECDNSIDSQNRSDYQVISVADITKNNPNLNQTIVEDPKATVLEAFGFSELQESQKQEIEVSCPQPDQVIVTLTKTGLLDDSVAGVRDRAEFTPHPQGWELIWLGRQQKCYPERGNTDWSTKLCL
jgi:hypothetical protein